MHAFSIVLPPATPTCRAVRNAIGADDAWADIKDAPHAIVCLYAALNDLGAISARFAARLVYAGALTALLRLAEKAPGRGAGAGAGDSQALAYEGLMHCFETFRRSVPQVSRRGYCGWIACCGCLFRIPGIRFTH